MRKTPPVPLLFCCFVAAVALAGGACKRQIAQEDAAPLGRIDGLPPEKRVAGEKVSKGAGAADSSRPSDVKAGALAKGAREGTLRLQIQKASAPCASLDLRIERLKGFDISTCQTVDGGSPRTNAERREVTGDETREAVAKRLEALVISNSKGVVETEILCADATTVTAEVTTEGGIAVYKGTRCGDSASKGELDVATVSDAMNAIVQDVRQAAANARDDASLESRRDAALADLKSVISDVRCVKTTDCKSLEVGAMACGGPQEYALYSLAKVSESAVLAKARAHADLVKELNAKTAAAGICLAVTAPGVPACVSGQCVWK